VLRMCVACCMVSHIQFVLIAHLNAGSSTTPV
jgi:hypothetical protein